MRRTTPKESDISLGVIEKINSRDVWQNEEKDFTPWLAKNIGQLSATVGLSIRVEQIEQKVGNEFC